MKTIEYRIIEKTEFNGKINYYPQYIETVNYMNDIGLFNRLIRGLTKFGMDFSDLQTNKDTYSIGGWRTIPPSTDYKGDNPVFTIERCREEIELDKAKRLYQHNQTKLNEKIIETDKLILE